MCPSCRHPMDDHDAAGICLVCSKLGLRCSGSGTATVTIRVPEGPKLWSVAMPAVTAAGYAARRVAEAMDLDPDARDWFLYDPVARRPLADGETMAAYHDRVLTLAWTEDRR